MIFIESKLFEKLREKYLEDESYRQLQNFLLEQPLAGDVIQGTGGLRKFLGLPMAKAREVVFVLFIFLSQRKAISTF